MKQHTNSAIRRLVGVTAFLLVLFSAHLAQANAISQTDFLDKNLGQCIQKAADKRGWKTLADITELKCHNKKIKNGAGLNQLTSLTSLSLFNNKLTQLDLAQLKNLTYLNLADNDLTKLNIRGLNQLETLFLFRNSLTTLDMQGLSSVKKVRMMQNQLKVLDITPLVALEEGYLFDNQLEDLAITGLSKLKFLDVRQNPMPDELYDFYDKQEGIVISHDGNADDWK